MKKLVLLIVVACGILVSSSAYSFAPDYEQKLMIPLQKEDATEIAKQLKILQASVDALCIKSRGFTANVVTADFYEYHSFLNLTIDYLQKTSYEVSERIRSVGTINAMANTTIADIQQMSKIQDAKSVVTNPQDMVAELVQDYMTVSNLTRGIFKMAAQVGDGGTIALMVGVTKQFEHFWWALNAMSSGRKASYK
jgi:starvation-inducible DNA-binding protein